MELKQLWLMRRCERRPPRRIGRGAVLKQARLRGPQVPALDSQMVNSKPRPAKSHQSDQATAAIDSALRTLDAEASGVTALAAALKSDLGPAFSRAAELILGAKGRLIITGLGKSGHIGRKIAATFASTGTPAFFVHAAEASHGDLGM